MLQLNLFYIFFNL